MATMNLLDPEVVKQAQATNLNKIKASGVTDEEIKQKLQEAYDILHPGLHPRKEAPEVELSMTIETDPLPALVIAGRNTKNGRELGFAILATHIMESYLYKVEFSPNIERLIVVLTKDLSRDEAQRLGLAPQNG